ncbi:hypothetical protein [Mycoplasma sp. CB776]
MFKPNVKIIKHIENKIKSLKKISKIYFWANIAFSALIIILNIYSIISAIIYLDYAATELVKDNSEIGRHITSKSQWIEILKTLSYTAIFVVFLITIFFLSLFLAIFKTSFHYNQYKKVQKQLTYLLIKYESQDEEYTIEQFKKELELVEPILINRNKKSLKKELKSTLLKKVN